MSQTPIQPDYSPEKKRERAKEYQLEALAQLSTLGTPTGTMAAVTGLSEPYIHRLMQGGQSKKFDELREQYKQQNLKTVVGAHFTLVDLLPQADDAIRDALVGHDNRLRAETAWKVRERVVPNLMKEQSNQDVFQITINQPHIQAQIGETMNSVAKSLAALQVVIKNQEPDGHLMSGADAIPRPPGQLEAVEGEASLEPTENPKTDLLTELIEREE